MLNAEEGSRLGNAAPGGRRLNATMLIGTIRKNYCTAASLRYYLIAGFLLLLLWNPVLKPVAFK